MNVFTPLCLVCNMCITVSARCTIPVLHVFPKFYAVGVFVY